MKVFISWSGERSRKVAELFKEWLPCVIQATKPWVSTQDIQGGSVWFNEINNELSETPIGIICLTAENKEKPWILFEAGALTKGLTTSRVIPFLIDIKPAEVENPLAQLNLVTYSKETLHKLVKDINANLEQRLDEKTLDNIFNTYWHQFKEKFDKILSDTPSQKKLDKRDDSEILNEVLLLVRDLKKSSIKAPAISDDVLSLNASVIDLTIIISGKDVEKVNEVISYFRPEDITHYNRRGKRHIKIKNVLSREAEYISNELLMENIEATLLSEPPTNATKLGYSTQ